VLNPIEFFESDELRTVVGIRGRDCHSLIVFFQSISSMNSKYRCDEEVFVVFEEFENIE